MPRTEPIGTNQQGNGTAILNRERQAQSNFKMAIIVTIDQVHSGKSTARNGIKFTQN